jgi:hypothetical protein
MYAVGRGATVNQNSISQNKQANMKKFFCFLTVALAFAALTTSCNKDDDAKSRTDYLTAHGWVIDKVEIKLNGVTIPVPVDVLGLSECGLGVVHSFTTDFKYGETGGTAECQELLKDELFTGTWKWKNGESTISTTIDGNTEDAPVLDLNDTTLKIDTGTISYDSNGDRQDDMEVPAILYFKAK